MKKIVFIACLSLLVLALSYGQSPAHESRIVAMTIEEDTLFSLDSNGLLLAYNTRTQAQTFSIPIRNTIERAFFQFPYIAIIDIYNNLHIYNMSNKFIEFSTPFLASHQGYVTFSSDFSRMAYTSPTTLRVLNTQTWYATMDVPYDATPDQFLYISKNKQNIMSYSYDGIITYYNIASGNILKQETTDEILQHLILSHTLRFGVGHTSQALRTIDVVTGETLDSLFFNESLTLLFQGDTRNQNTLIHSVSNNEDSINIRSFEISDDGKIQEQDLYSITLGKNNVVSSIISQQSFMYVGSEEGQIARYPYTTPNASASLIVKDNTLAVYDAIYQNNTIMLTTIAGILSIPADSLLSPSQDSLIPTQAEGILAQQLVNPVFITTRNETKEGRNDARALASQTRVLSTNQPFQHTIPLSSTTDIREPNRNTDTTLNNTNSLLFSLSDQSQIKAPIPLPPDISNMIIHTPYIISYSKMKSHLYVNTSDTQEKIPLYSSRFLFDTSETDDEGTILWTNTPLLNATQETTQSNNNSFNTIYGYTLNSTPTLVNIVSLPFVQSEIHTFHALHTTPPSFIVSTIAPHSNANSFLLISVEHTRSPAEEMLQYPQYIQQLSNSTPGHVLKTIAIGEKKEHVLVFSQDYIEVISLNHALNDLQYEYTIPYPKEFGIFLNAQITSLSETETAREYVLTLVDNNNTIVLLRLAMADAPRFQTITSFNVYNNNEIIYLRAHTINE